MSIRSYGELLDALRGVRWPARRTVGAALPGAHRSRQRGTAGEFTEYRLYRQGDDPRQIDWRLLARSDRTFVRLTDDHALMQTWFIVDASLSMNFPASAGGNESTTGGTDGTSRTKWMAAQDVCIALAAVALASGDPVGLLVNSAHGMVQFAPRSRRGTVGELAHTLDAVALGGTQSLTELLLRVPAMARVVIITDLLGNEPELLRTAAQRTVAGGIVECVHIVAAEEIDLPVGMYLASDPDDDSIQRPMDKRAHNVYREKFSLFRAECARAWRASGAGYVELRTDADIARMVRAFVAGVSGHTVTNADRT